MDQKENKSSKQLIIEKIKSSQNILIVCHVNPDGDALGSSLALSHSLQKIGKKTSIAAAGQISPKFNFLPGIEEVKNELSSTKEFIITLTTSNTKPPHKVKYKTENDKIHLIITPGEGNFKTDDISFQEGGHKYDLIICLDTPNLEYLDSIYDTNTELFYETPIINIDHHSDNESYGELNFIDPQSSSVAEIMISFIETLSNNQNLLDQNIATCILTGILNDTACFQNSNTSPKSLTVTAQMIAAGANHHLVIKNLFKTQSLAQLKAWGKILTKLQTKPSLKIAWSTISLAELNETQAQPEDISGIIDALLRNLPDVNIFLLLVQTTDLIKGSLRSVPSININPIATELGGGGHPQASGFRIYDMTLEEAEKLSLNTISKHLSLEQNTPQSPDNNPSNTNKINSENYNQTPKTINHSESNKSDIRQTNQQTLNNFQPPVYNSSDKPTTPPIDPDIAPSKNEPDIESYDPTNPPDDSPEEEYNS